LACPIALSIWRLRLRWSSVPTIRRKSNFLWAWGVAMSCAPITILRRYWLNPTRQSPDTPNKAAALSRPVR
jgi:hypothetical protein